MPSSNTQTLQIAEILRRRRQQIDREIAEFKAGKEEDYIAFEKKVWAQGQDNDRQHNIQSTFGDKDIDERPQEPPLIDEEHESNQSIATRKDTLVDSSDRVYSINRQELQPRTTDFSIHTRKEGSEPRGVSASLSAPSFHEREVEFQGLFTPCYLPLLESSTKNQKHVSKKPSLTLSIQSNLSITPNPDSSALSPSAPYSASTISTSNSLHTPDRTESVVSQERSLGLRRSSSRSDTSIASLRSSLRDPKQPRSPKRVLFSIGDAVVSPSSSPVAQRSRSAPQAKLPRLNFPQDLAKDATGKMKQEFAGAEVRKAVEPYFPPVSTPCPPSSSLAERRDFKSGPSHLGPDIAHSSAYASDDDVEGVGFGDDLFAFDGDMDIGELEHAPKDMGDFESDEEENGTKDENSSSSPHAGSLPIEIKWPARHDPRK